MTVARSFVPAATLDVTGRPCPDPVVATREYTKELKQGDVLLLISDCGWVVDDLGAWARATGNEILEVERVDERRKGYYIRKAFQWPVKAVVDTRGARCPMPVVEADRALRRLESGDVIKLISNCPSAEAEVATWARNTGHKLLDTVRNAVGDLRFYVQKR